MASDRLADSNPSNPKVQIARSWARVRVGTEVLRTGGGVTLTSVECSALLNHRDALLDENQRLRDELENAESRLAGITNG